MPKFCSSAKLAEPFNINVKCVDAKTSLEKLDQAAVFLPHLQFAHLAEYYSWFCREAFSLGKAGLDKFWEGMQKVWDDRLEGHPMCLEKHWNKISIPLFLHGDGVEYKNRDSMMVWSWGCKLGDQASLEKHMLLAAFPKSCTTRETWPPSGKSSDCHLKLLEKGCAQHMTLMAGHWKRVAPCLEKQGCIIIPEASEHMSGQCRGVMSSTATARACPIGHPTSDAGNVLLKTFLAVTPA